MPKPEVPGPELPRVGDTIGRKYSLVGRLGEGAMGVVFEAMHLRLRQRLAVKVLRPDFNAYDEVFTRFEREARITAQLRSIHTARVIDVDTLENGLPYIVMEFLEGRDLAAEIDDLGALPVNEAVDVTLQIAAAMQEAHDNGIVHRDLKPANLFVCRSGGRRVMKVLDFGISRAEGENSKITQSHNTVGTPCYASPEQLADATQADPRSDVWSLGIILYEMLSGRTPFQGSVTSVIARVMSQDPPWLGALRPELPKDIVRIVMTALNRQPEGRFQSMRDFSAALAPFGLERSTTDALTEAQRGRTRVGEILVADGLLEPDGLKQALAEQRRTGHLLGKTLLDLGLVSRADLLAALAKQQGIEATVPPPGPAAPEAPIVREQRAAREAMTFGGTVARMLVSGMPPRKAWMMAAVVAGLVLGVIGVAVTTAALRSAPVVSAPTGIAVAAARPAEPTQVVAAPPVVAPVGAEAQEAAPPVAAPQATTTPSTRSSAPHAPVARQALEVRFDPTDI
jgi:eukaryotic-like serine/threonine-protein kinase